jgi:hypothetical protein
MARIMIFPHLSSNQLCLPDAVIEVKAQDFNRVEVSVCRNLTFQRGVQSLWF